MTWIWTAWAVGLIGLAWLVIVQPRRRQRRATSVGALRLSLRTSPGRRQAGCPAPCPINGHYAVGVDIGADQTARVLIVHTQPAGPGSPPVVTVIRPVATGDDITALADSVRET